MAPGCTSETLLSRSAGQRKSAPPGLSRCAAARVVSDAAAVCKRVSYEFVEIPPLVYAAAPDWFRTKTADRGIPTARTPIRCTGVLGLMPYSTPSMPPTSLMAPRGRWEGSAKTTPMVHVGD